MNIKGEPLTVFGDGSQTRSFCYVDDEVEGIYRLYRSGCVDPVNIGNPAEMTVLEFTHLVKRLTNSSSEIVFRPLPIDDPCKRQPDISKAKALLNWEPKVLLEDGLKETIAYIKTKI